MRRTAFVKVSGDLIKRRDVLDWLQSYTREYYVVLCAGGGSQINEAFTARGWDITFGPLGRECKTFEQRQLARDILERNQADMQDMLAREGIAAVVIIPVLDLGSVLCHVNGDHFPIIAYLGYDRVIVLTLESRGQDKQERYKAYPKIEVVCFSDSASGEERLLAANA